MRRSRAAAPRRASTSTGRRRERRSTRSTRRSRRRSPSSPHSTLRSASCSRRASRPRSSGTCASAVLRAGVKAMGFELFSPDEDRSAVVTAVRSPESAEIVKALRDRFGITLAGGQGDLKGKIFRIGHIGWFDVFDITTALAAIEIVSAELGLDIERGVAVTAALEAYEHTSVA